MAKSNREIVAMVCQKCKSHNYVTRRNKNNMLQKSPDASAKLVMSKFCSVCRAHTEHKESSKLK